MIYRNYHDLTCMLKGSAKMISVFKNKTIIMKSQR